MTELGACRNALLDDDGSVLVECPHGGTAIFLPFDRSGILANLPPIRGLCAECAADLDADEERERSQRRADAIAAVRDGPRDRSWSFETYPKDGPGALAAAVAQQWLASYKTGSRRNLIVWGAVGNGKTGLAWCIVRDLIETQPDADPDRGERALRPRANLVNWRNLLHDIQASFDASPGDRRETLTRYFDVPVLVVDDVGAERPTDWRREQLATIVDHRYMRQLPTIATSNYNPDELVARLGHDDPIAGKRIISRISEGALLLEIKARDRRKG